MKIDELTQNLYNTSVNNLKTTAISNAAKAVTTGETANVSDFKDLLSKELSSLSDASKLSQFSELANALDKSVLGNLASYTDLTSLSEDLLGTSGGREVLSKLCEGQLNSIVLTDKSDNDSTGITNNLNSYTNSIKETQTLKDAIDTALETLNTTNKE